MLLYRTYEITLLSPRTVDANVAALREEVTKPRPEGRDWLRHFLKPEGDYFLGTVTRQGFKLRSEPDQMPWYALMQLIVTGLFEEGGAENERARLPGGASAASKIAVTLGVARTQNAAITAALAAAFIWTVAALAAGDYEATAVALFIFWMIVGTRYGSFVSQVRRAEALLCALFEALPLSKAIPDDSDDA